MGIWAKNELGASGLAARVRVPRGRRGLGRRVRLPRWASVRPLRQAAAHPRRLGGRFCGLCPGVLWSPAATSSPGSFGSPALGIRFSLGGSASPGDGRRPRRARQARGRVRHRACRVEPRGHDRPAGRGDPPVRRWLEPSFVGVRSSSAIAFVLAYRLASGPGRVRTRGATRPRLVRRDPARPSVSPLPGLGDSRGWCTSRTRRSFRSRSSTHGLEPRRGASS